MPLAQRSARQQYRMCGTNYSFESAAADSEALNNASILEQGRWPLPASFASYPTSIAMISGIVTIGGIRTIARIDAPFRGSLF